MDIYSECYFESLVMEELSTIAQALYDSNAIWNLLRDIEVAEEMKTIQGPIVIAHHFPYCGGVCIPPPEKKSRATKRCPEVDHRRWKELMPKLFPHKKVSGKISKKDYRRKNRRRKKPY